MRVLPTGPLIGQLLMADFDGPEPTPWLRQLVAAHGLGGVILFRKNLQRPAQVAGLCAALQALAARAGLPPLLIAIDQEGGPVERLPVGLPSAMALGATGDPDLALAAGRLTGRVLRAAGVNVDFAPVLDVNTNPRNPVIGIRAYGDDPALVARLAGAFARGLLAEGVVPTGKHFPGHGDTDVDSHEGLPVIPHPQDRLEAVEFVPFRALVAEGLPALMTAHVAFAADAGRLPATLSPAVLDGLLRRRWGFDGVIVTDSLAMAPIAEGFGVGPAAVQALVAGADLLLACGGPAVQEAVLRAVADAVEAGVLARERLGASHARLERLRRLIRPTRGGTGAGGPEAGAAVGPDDVEAVLADPARQQTVAAIADGAVTVVRDDAELVPLPPAPLRVLTLLPPPPRSDPGDPAQRVPSPSLGAALQACGRTVTEVVLPAGAAWDGEVGVGEVVVVVTTSRGRPDPWQTAIAHRALAAGRPALAVAAGTPYDLLALPEAPTYLATYGWQATLEAAARVLTGRVAPRGRLPVTIPGHYPAGHGIVRA